MIAGVVVLFQIVTGSGNCQCGDQIGPCLRHDPGCFLVHDIAMFDGLNAAPDSRADGPVISNMSCHGLSVLRCHSRHGPGFLFGHLDRLRALIFPHHAAGGADLNKIHAPADGLAGLPCEFIGSAAFHRAPIFRAMAPVGNDDRPRRQNPGTHEHPPLDGVPDSGVRIIRLTGNPDGGHAAVQSLHRSAKHHHGAITGGAILVHTVGRKGKAQ